MLEKESANNIWGKEKNSSNPNGRIHLIVQLNSKFAFKLPGHQNQKEAKLIILLLSLESICIR